MVAARSVRPARRPLPPLENGDRLDQKTFHARYEAMPSEVRAELIGGTVYMASPMRMEHGESAPFARWLDEYEEATPGTRVLLGATNILGPESEPQPDSCLIILPQNGGQTWKDNKGYLNGAPEWVGEISHASESIDLHGKKQDYERAGVREYVVVALRQGKVFWFTRHRGKFKDMPAGTDGIFRSDVFPGLWLEPSALLRRDRKRLLTVLHQGLASPEHAAFVQQLAARAK